MNDLALRITEERRNQEHFAHALREFGQAHEEAQVLARELLARFDRIDAVRPMLEQHGVLTAVEYEPAIQAALLRHREILRDPYDIPEFMKQPL